MFLFSKNSILSYWINHYNDLSNITKINRDLVKYDGPCTAGNPITISEKAYATHTTYSISVISSAGSTAFDFGIQVLHRLL